MNKMVQVDTQISCIIINVIEICNAFDIDMALCIQ